MLYEDLQYLSVSAVGLAGAAGLLMLSMWLLDKVYRRIAAWRRRRQSQGEAERRHQLMNVITWLIKNICVLNSAENDATELQHL